MEILFKRMNTYQVKGSSVLIDFERELVALLFFCHENIPI